MLVPERSKEDIDVQGVIYSQPIVYSVFAFP